LKHPTCSLYYHKLSSLIFAGKMLLLRLHNEQGYSTVGGRKNFLGTGNYEIQMANV
jgi:hypothetical protein